MSAIETAGGRVVTFYSYKGGTGRTMALANAAWLLADNGYRVLAVDWDLESPGLHRYFHPFLKDKDQRYTEGILDLVRKYAAATLQVGRSEKQLRDVTSILEYAVSLDWDFPQGGNIDFVGAGRQDDGYGAAVSTFDWESFWSRLNGGQVIDRLRDEMRRHYDFVLIDSRTGTSDTAGICTIQLPDVVVNCFTLNTQSVTGAEAITTSIVHGAPAVTVYPVPTRIENSEKEKLDRRRGYARKLFAPHLTFLDEDEDPDRYWDAAEVPYIPYYAYEEILAVFGDRPGQNELLARYQRLTCRIAGHDCPPRRLAEAERRRVLREFERTEGDQVRLLVVYGPLDRIWAEWVRDRFQGPRIPVQLHCIRHGMPDMASADRMIVTVSRDLVAHPDGARLLRVAFDRVMAGEVNFAAAVRMDATSAEPLPSRSVVDVVDAQESAAIERLSAALALDDDARPALERRHEPSIRYPMVVTPHWNVRLARNARFSGRGAILEEIRDRLKSAGLDRGRLVLSGLPGVGKTLLALEYVYRFAASYDVVWWISVTEPAQARVALADLATQLGLTAGTDVEVMVASVLAALRQGKPTDRWLVVFDNADSLDDLEGLLPTGPGDVLLTSRNPQWSTMPNLDINVFHRHESIELLTRRVPGILPEDASRLAARLGDLPLALEQAGGWISSTGMAVDDYLRLFHRDAAEAMNAGAPIDHRSTITTTVRVAYEELGRRHPAAARLLELYACMAPDAIPFRLISNERLSALLTPFDPMMRDPMRHAGLNREIGQYGLARTSPAKDGGGVVLHRLTQDIIRALLHESGEESARLTEVRAVLAAASRGDPDSTNSWGNFEALRPHLPPAGVLTAEAPEVRHLVIQMVRYLWRRGDAASSVELGEEALKEWEPRFGADDASTLRLRIELGAALRFNNRDTDAYLLDRDTHQRLCRTLGENDQYTLRAAYLLAADLRDRGNYHEARELDEKTAPRLRDLLGDEDRFALNAANNLAVSLRLVGEYDKAVKLDRETGERRRKVLGITDPDTLSSAANLGVDLRLTGHLTAAADRLKSVFAHYEEVLGADHQRSVWAGHDYAVTLRLLGEAASASEVIEHITRRAESLFGGNHPTTLACRLEAACALWAEGRYEAAREAGEYVFAAYRTRHDEHHPDTLAAGSTLSVFRRLAGDADGAAGLAAQCAERLAAAIGPRHPYTLTAQLVQANAEYDGGERSAARQRDEEVYGRLRKALRDDHPTVLAAAVNYAVSHRAEHGETAETMRRTALRLLRGSLGERHPYTTAAENWRRIEVGIEPLQK
jgi:hypothetical protein